jgi:hypothetical protein
MYETSKIEVPFKNHVRALSNMEPNLNSLAGQRQTQVSHKFRLFLL